MSKKIPKDERQFWIQRGFKDPQLAYTQQRVSAKQRGIEFQLTATEWWDLWAPHYHERGRTTGKKVMCRHLDKGPYKIGNVRIDTIRSNMQEAARTKSWRAVRQEWGERTDMVEWVGRDRSQYEPSEMLEKFEEMLDI